MTCHECGNCDESLDANDICDTCNGCRSKPKSAGQLAYESDVTASPRYHDRTPRRSWYDLSHVARCSWERNPTPRGAA